MDSLSHGFDICIGFFIHLPLVVNFHLLYSNGILQGTRVKGASGAQREALRAALSLFKTFQGNQSLFKTFEDF